MKKEFKPTKAWATIKKDSKLIPQNFDDPQFMCVFSTKNKAQDSKFRDEEIIKVKITQITK